MPDTSTPSKAVAPRKLTLEVAAFNWRSARVQFALGFCLITIFSALLLQEFFATRFLLGEYMNIGNLLATTDAANNLRNTIPFSTNPITALEVVAFENHSWLYRVATFVVAAASALLVGLIHFDTILRFGNRTGAGAAIFCALLYLTMPFGNGLTLPSTTLAVLLSLFFGLCAMYLDMRARLLKETPFVYAALVAILLAGLLDGHGVAIACSGIICQRIMLPDSDRQAEAHPGWSFIRAIPVVYVFIALAFIIPTCIEQSWSPQALDLSQITFSKDLDSTATFRAFHKILALLIVTVFGIALFRSTIGSLWLRPFLFPLIWLIALFLLGPALGGFTSEFPLTLYLAAPICIVLASAALPCIDTLGRRMRIALTVVGCTVLSAIVVICGSITAQILHQLCVEARDLSFFKVELARHFASTTGRLVIVNPPFSMIDKAVQATRKSDSAMGAPNELAGLRDRDAILYQCMLNSPLSNQKSPVTTLRKIPSAFVRLAHEAVPNQNVPYSKVTDYFAWDNEARQLMPIYYLGADALKLDLADTATIEKMKSDPAIVRVKDRDWAEIQRGKAYIEIENGGIRMNSGESEDLSVWFSHQPLDPTKVARVVVNVENPANETAVELFLVFKGTEDDDIGAIPLRRVGHSYIAETRGVSDWHKHKSIVTIGIKLSAGSPAVVLSSIEGAAGRKTNGI